MFSARLDTIKKVIQTAVPDSWKQFGEMKGLINPVARARRFPRALAGMGDVYAATVPFTL